MKCGICEAVRVRRYFTVKDGPRLQNVLYDSEKSARHVSVVSAEFWVCESCLFLFNPTFENQRYSVEYNNDQSFSGVYREHLVSVGEFLEKYLHPSHRIVEIGCGNGLFLSMLMTDGYPAVEGYDPAHSENLPFVRREYWQPSGRKCDALILRHTLESLPNFREILSAAMTELTLAGIIYLELTNSRTIVETASTLTLYHEYPQYFSEISIGLLLNEFGFYVHEIRHFSDGEILGIVARAKTLLPLREPKLHKLREFKSVCIWGIGGRSIHFLSNYGIDSGTIQYAVDLDPRKQGKFVPRTGQKVVSPQDCVRAHPNAVVVLNERYVGEIAKLFSYPVAILTARDLFGDC
jgi:hypothetical protein